MSHEETGGNLSACGQTGRKLSVKATSVWFCLCDPWSPCGVSPALCGRFWASLRGDGQRQVSVASSRPTHGRVPLKAVSPFGLLPLNQFTANAGLGKSGAEWPHGREDAGWTHSADVLFELAPCLWVRAWRLTVVARTAHPA